MLSAPYTLSRQARSLADNDSDARALHLRRQAAGFFHAGNTTVSEISRGKRGQLRPERTAGVAASNADSSTISASVTKIVPVATPEF